MPDRILIVDDEQHIRRMMRLTLEAAGYEVGEAQDGLEGLKLYGDGSKWAGVILDQRMPGMDGLETLRQLKEQDRTACVVMATAFASIELAVDAMKLGAHDFVRKPMTPEVLRNTVKAALSKVKNSSFLPTPRARPATAPPIQTITMNGFTILDDEESPPLDPQQRRFRVITPDGDEHEVVVEIGINPIDYVERMTARRLGPEDSFWTLQAKCLLSDHLWDEGEVPRTRRLVMTNLAPDQLQIAARWRG